MQVAIEGHADERGTKEYNMALGERRSKVVEQFLVVNGVSKSQIETMSFGERTQLRWVMRKSPGLKTVAQ